MRFYEELVKFIIGPKLLVIGPFRFLRPNIYFSNLFGNLVRDFLDYLVENDCSKINLYFSYHKMVNMKYCKVQVHELGWFNHYFIILLQFITMPK